MNLFARVAVVSLAVGFSEPCSEEAGEVCEGDDAIRVETLMLQIKQDKLWGNLSQDSLSALILAPHDYLHYLSWELVLALVVVPLLVLGAVRVVRYNRELLGIQQEKNFIISSHAWRLLGHYVNCDECHGSAIAFQDWSLYVASQHIYQKPTVRLSRHEGKQFWCSAHLRNVRLLEAQFSQTGGCLPFKQKQGATTDNDGSYWSWPNDLLSYEADSYVHVPYFCDLRVGTAADASFGTPTWIEHQSDTRTISSTTEADAAVEANCGDASASVGESGQSKTGAGESRVVYDIVVPMARLGFDTLYMQKKKAHFMKYESKLDQEDPDRKLTSEESALKDWDPEGAYRRIDAVIVGISLQIEGVFSQTGTSEDNHANKASLEYGLGKLGAMAAHRSFYTEAPMDSSWTIIRQEGIDISDLIKEGHDARTMKAKLAERITKAKGCPDMWEPLFVEVNHYAFVHPDEARILNRCPSVFMAFMKASSGLLVSALLKEILRRLFAENHPHLFLSTADLLAAQLRLDHPVPLNKLAEYLRNHQEGDQRPVSLSAEAEPLRPKHDWRRYEFDGKSMSDAELILEAAGFNIVSDYGFINKNNEIMVSRKAIELWWTQHRFRGGDTLEGDGGDQGIRHLDRQTPALPSCAVARCRIESGNTVPSSYEMAGERTKKNRDLDATAEKPNFAMSD